MAPRHRTASWLAVLAFVPAVAAAQSARPAGDRSLLESKFALRQAVLRLAPAVGADVGTLLRRIELVRTETALRSLAREVEGRTLAVSMPTFDLDLTLRKGSTRGEAPVRGVTRLARPLPHFDMRGVWMPSPDAD